jgi:hypothetical protein
LVAECVEHGGERPVAVAVVVAVRLGVRRDRDERRPGAGRLRRGPEARGPAAPVAQQAAERDLLGDGLVVGEHREPEARRGGHEPRAPRRRQRAAGGAAQLVWGEHGEAHARGGDHVERLVVGGRLGEPQPVGVAPEAAAELGEPPAHLGRLVAAAEEREDGVVVRVRERPPVAQAALRGAVGGEHRGVGRRPLAGQPREERRGHVEARQRERVDDAADPPVGVVHPPRRQDAVALALDARGEVVVGARRDVARDVAEPGVLARRLVEVQVDDDGRHGRAARGGGSGRQAPARPSTRRYTSR